MAQLAWLINIFEKDPRRFRYEGSAGTGANGAAWKFRQLGSGGELMRKIVVKYILPTGDVVDIQKEVNITEVGYRIIAIITANNYLDSA